MWVKSHLWETERQDIKSSCEILSRPVGYKVTIGRYKVAIVRNKVANAKYKAKLWDIKS